MIFSRDRDFEEALADPVALEQRLALLQKDRKRALIMSVVLISVFCLSAFLALAVHYKTKTIGQHVIIAPMMAFLALQQFVAVISYQNDIRTLLVFKKLRQLSEPD
jgi:hypothetical protein